MDCKTGAMLNLYKTTYQLVILCKYQLLAYRRTQTVYIRLTLIYETIELHRTIYKYV